jgi:hypothetical protein
MSSDTVLCTGCGITLRPFMTRCPRCGAERDALSATKTTASNQAEVLQLSSETPRTTSAPQAAATAPALQQAPLPAQTGRVPLDDLRRRALQQEEFQSSLPNTVMMSPPDEVRRFPLFTRAQIILMLVGLGLLGLGLLIGYLLWSREKTDTSLTLNRPPLAGQAAPAPALALPEASLTPDPNASPTPTLSIDDQVLFEEAKKVLAAYNPTGVARYQITVKDGVVTLEGSAEHQPEKEGATNVLRLLAGAKQIVNKLAIKTDLSLFPSPTLQPTTTPASTEASLNPPSVALSAPTTPPTDTHNQQADADAQRARQQEAERLQREQEAARQREAEAQRQREADAQKQREVEEATRHQQQEEARRLEADKQPPAPKRTEASALRSGTVAWSGVVDGVDEIVIGGGSAAIRHLSGDAVRETRTSFSAAVPRAPVSVKLLSTTGRGTIQIVQQPAAANGYTTIVRIDDSAQRGGQAHQFTLRWSVQ